MMKTILAAIDFSDLAKQVVIEAGKLARSLQTKVYLLHSVEPEPDFVGYDDDPQVMRDQIASQYHREHRLLQEYAQSLRDQGVDATAVLARGMFSDTILEHAEKVGAELVIVGSHGRGALSTLVVGSCSQQVIRSSTVPVVVVPQQRKP